MYDERRFLISRRYSILLMIIYVSVECMSLQRVRAECLSDYDRLACRGYTQHQNDNLRTSRYDNF
jgi:hypothetical protein